MKAEQLTAYQASVFLILNDGRVGQRFTDEAALALIEKHSAMIADRGNRHFEPFATARAIVEAEILAHEDAICDEIDAVIERVALECVTCPECQERFVPVVNEAHVCGAPLPQETKPRERVLGVAITLERSTGSRYITTIEGDEAAKWEAYLDEVTAYLRERGAYPPFEKLKIVVVPSDEGAREQAEKLIRDGLTSAEWVGERLMVTFEKQALLDAIAQFAADTREAAAVKCGEVAAKYPGIRSGVAEFCATAIREGGAGK